MKTEDYARSVVGKVLGGREEVGVGGQSELGRLVSG
jgi:hypothetical protein